MALLAAAPTASAGTITLGSTVINDGCAVTTANKWVGKVYTLSETAVTQTFSIYVETQGLDTDLRLVMYKATGATSYGSRVVLSASFTIAAMTTQRWVTVDVPHVQLPPGNYLVAVFSGSGSAQLFCVDTSGAANGTDSFASPSNPYGGTITASTSEYAMYVTLETNTSGPDKTVVVVRADDGVPYCSNRWQANPDFALITNPAIFTRLSVDMFTKGNWSPYAVPVTSLSPAVREHLRNLVAGGKYALVCNLDTGWTPGVQRTGTYTDVTGDSIPGTEPWVNENGPIPANFEIAA